MTPQEEKDFLAYGCSSACLIRITELRKRPISREDFVTANRDRFQNGQCGRLTFDKLCEIAMGFGFFDGVYSVRDPAYAKHLITNPINADVLAILDLKRDTKSGRLVSSFHCTLVLGWKDSGNLATDEVYLYYPYQDSAPREEWRTFAELEERLVHFLVLS